MSRLDWATDGRRWPNRAASRFVEAGGLRWHVQVAGAGPVLLLVHGTGSATHSWRALLPLLSEDFTVVAADLPGHGFSGAPPRGGYALPRIARAIAALLGVLDQAPALAVGHSAGAAVLARMCLDGLIAPARLISLNGALMPLRGMPTEIFVPIAKLLASSSLAARAFAAVTGGEAGVNRLIRSGGSDIDDEGRRLYARLASNPGHVAGALGLMAHWDLPGLARDLPGLRTPLTLVSGGADRMVAPFEAARVKALVPGAELISLPGLGHLAHEEQPEAVARIIRAAR